MNKIRLKKLAYGKNALLSLFFLELLYLLYSYTIADSISIAVGADGFLAQDISAMIPLEIFLSIFLIPPIEELIARTSINKELNYFGFSFVFLLLISVLFYFYSKMISLVFLSVLIVLVFLGFYKGFSYLKQKVKKYFICFFLISSFLFAFVHIPAVNSTYEELDFGARLIVVSFSIFPFAIILGMVRLKYGLKYSILLHILNNGLILILNSFIYQ
tara:strand:- start:68 stop:715 length:648 start_codon:yes stop_codon:yes gene_type:complete